MKVSIKVSVFIFFILSINGCVNSTPTDTASKVAGDFGLNQPCIDMFNAVPVDCKNNPSLCVGMQGYQEVAQGSQMATFVISKDEDDKVRLCTWSAVGFMRGRDYVDNYVLASCERQRLTWMSRNKKSLQACKVYAYDNDIL